MKLLAAPFNAALKVGYVSVNPCSGVELLRDDADTEKDVFTSDQMRALLTHAEGDWHGTILMGFYTGLRLGDMTGLCWETVAGDLSVLRIKTGKTGKVVTLPPILKYPPGYERSRVALVKRRSSLPWLENLVAVEMVSRRHSAGSWRAQALQDASCASAKTTVLVGRSEALPFTHSGAPSTPRSPMRVSRRKSVKS